MARLRCSDEARERADPMVGTAAPGRSWLLVEHPGPWPHRGFDGLDLAAPVRAEVVAAARSAGARILLVRRHGRQPEDRVRRWAVLHHEDTGAYRQSWGTWRGEQDLRGVTTALQDPGEVGRPPVLLVCAHGVHDTCCAVRGRPVAAALTRRWPELTWECSHVGGDRFAANVVVVPDGVYYGGLDASSAVEVVTDHLAGKITAPHLRGYTTLPGPQQVAVVAAIRSLGSAARHELEVVDAQLQTEGRWTVQLRRRSEGGVLTVQLRTERAAPHLLTCRAPEPAAAWRHVVTGVQHEVRG